jgi:hypothetical protein
MSIHLANPAALWLLPAAIVPLLLARRRQPLPRRIVSNLYLWRGAAPHDSAPAAVRRTRATWLIALQIACILAIVGAMAGPEFTLAASRVALVFDVSASLAAADGATTRLAEARRRAATLVADLPAASRVRLIAAASSPRLVGDYAAADPRLVAAIEGLAPTGGTADIAAAIDLAAASGDPGGIVVISDAAQPGQPAAAGTPATGAAAARWEQVGHAVSNMAITRVAVRPRSLGSEAGDVLVQVRNFSAQPRDAEVTISSDAGHVRSLVVRVPAEESRTLIEPLPPAGARGTLGAVITARLTGGDGLAADNTRSAVVPPSGRVRTALLGYRGTFVEQALVANPAVALMPFASATDAEAEVARGGIDLVVCAGCTDAPAFARAALVLPPIGSGALRGRLTVVNSVHPVTTALDLAALPAAPAPTPVRAGADILARADGVPAIVALDSDGRRIVDIGLDLSDQAFALTAAFPVLIANAVDWLAAAGALPSEAVAGDPVRVAVVDSASATGPAVTVTGPDGRQRATARAGSQIVVTDTSTPGIYHVHRAGDERPLAINAATDGESDLQAAGASADAVPLAATSVGITDSIAAAPLLAVLALLLLAGEWRFSTAGTR